MYAIGATGTMNRGAAAASPAPVATARAAAVAAPPAAPAAPVDRATPNWSALALILLAHAALLAALVLFDVIPVTRKPAPVRTVIELVPLPIAPPPPAAPVSAKAPPMETPQPQTLVAPPPIVQTAAPAAVPVPPAPPPVPTVVPPAAPATPAAGPPAAVSAPTSGVGEFGNEPPRYPPLSLRKREQGMVRLRVVIDAAGRVRDIAVAVSSGFDRLDRAALDGIRRWRFHPGLAAGQPVDGAIGFLNYTFALRG